MTDPNKPPFNAAPGDRLVVRAHHQGDAEMDAEILEVSGEDGGPPYLVRWEADGHISRVYPAEDVHIQHFPKHRA